MLVIPFAMLLLAGTPAEAAPAAPPRGTEAAGPALAELERAAALLSGGAPAASPDGKGAEAAAPSTAILAKLKRAADADRNGVVSPEEALDLRRTVEFGIEAARLAEASHGDQRKLRDQMHVGKDEFDRRVAAFRGISAAVADLPGVRVPELRLGAHGTPGAGGAN